MSEEQAQKLIETLLLIAQILNDIKKIMEDQ